MKLLFDFFPLVLFFIVYKIWGIYVATGVLIVGSLFQMAYMWFKYKRIEPMHAITFVLVLVFGGLTIILHDVMFLKWKVSIVNWLFAIAFLLSRFFMKKTLIEHLFNMSAKGKTEDHNPLHHIPKTVMHKLNWMWTGFFFILGALNLFVVYHFSTSVWVDFKVFGIMGLTVIFIIIQTFYLMKEIKKIHQK